MMSKLGVFLSRQELRVVFDGFDANKDGNIQWTEFIEGLKVSFLCQFYPVTPGYFIESLD